MDNKTTETKPCAWAPIAAQLIAEMDHKDELKRSGRNVMLGLLLSPIAYYLIMKAFGVI